MSFTGKVGIVTGGGSGLGEAGAKKLALDGARLIVADRNAEDAERVAAEIRSAGGDATAFRADVSVLGDVRLRCVRCSTNFRPPQRARQRRSTA